MPNLLINGSSGIAVGMATNIPPHNLNEIINATIALIQNPKTPLEKILELVPGPDFPTGGFLIGRQGILEAYTRGRGMLRLRAKAAIEHTGKDRDQIVVTEIPYQVNKARLIEQVAELINEKRLEGLLEPEIVDVVSGKGEIRKRRLRLVKVLGERGFGEHLKA